MKKLLVVLCLMLSASTVMAVESADVAAGNGSGVDKSMVTAIAMAPVTVPANLLALPFDGMMRGYEESAKIQNETGRIAVRVAMAPLWVPAAVLKVPSFLLEQAYSLFKDSGSGTSAVVASSKQ